MVIPVYANFLNLTIFKPKLFVSYWVISLLQIYVFKINISII